MKLPFNLDDSYPLTLGVADDYFTLSTRLKRLGRAPKSPRKPVRWAFGLALLVSFAAVVPVRLTARAQNKAQAQSATELSGTVEAASGQTVAGATVYLMKYRNFGGQPLETVVTDEAGRYRFSDEFGDDKNIVVFADAGARGMGQSYFWKHGRNLRVSNPIVSSLAPVRLLLLRPDGTRAANLRVRVGQLGRDVQERWSLPRSVEQSLQTLTNARGEAVFAGLPKDATAQFYLADHSFRETKYGLGDLRGGKYAPLAWADAVKVGASQGWKTIRLAPSIRVEGRVVTPEGQGRSDVMIVARRINAAESAGDYNGREMLLPQTRTDADGRYAMEGLRPGSYLFELPPEKTLARDYVGPMVRRTLEKPANFVNLPLARGAVIRGVLLQKSSKAPLVGVTVGLSDLNRTYQYEKTDARGAFQFRVRASYAYLWIQRGHEKLPTKVSNNAVSASGVSIFTYRDTGEKELQVASQVRAEKLSISGGNLRGVVRGVPFFNPSEMITLPAKEGTTREITIESALAPVAKPVTGTVVGPDGKAVKNALISVEGVSASSFNIWRGKTSTDESGRFEVPASLVKDAARLFARDGADADLVSARGTVVRGGDDVTLRLQANVYGAAAGQITDEKTGRPLPDVVVICYAPADSSSVDEVTTGADGRFRFERLRPFQANFLQIAKRGYEEVGSGTFVLQKNETKRLTIALPPLDKTLSGRVLLANGQSAGAGYRVMVSTGQGRTQTKADGSFVLGQVLDKKFTLTVIAPDRKKVWTPYWTRGGRSGVTLQLTDARLDSRLSVTPESRAQEAARNKSRIELIGKAAPPLQARRWIGTPPSFAGKVTLVQFVDMSDHSSALNDFARDFGNRGVQIVGVEQLRALWETEVRPGREEYLVEHARDLGLIYPVAIDQPLPDEKSTTTVIGQSHRLYRGARFVIVGRDGKVKWVGGDPGQAIAQTAKLAS